MALAAPVPFLWPGGRLSLPVGGLGVTAAQSIIFTLQQCMTKEQDEEVARMWLQTLQLCQVFHERLLSDLEQVDTNLSFWNKRLQEGAHVQFMLLQRGPITFVRYMKRALRRTVAWVRHLLQQRRLRQQQQQQAGESGQDVAQTEGAADISAGITGAAEGAQEQTRGSGAAFRFGIGRSKDASSGPTSATNKMQRRVLLLEALRNILAETLAQVTQAARLLWLHSPPSPGSPTQHRSPRAFQPTWASSGLVSSGDTSGSWEGNQAGNQALMTAAQDASLQAVQRLQQLLTHMRQQLEQLNQSKQTRAVLQEAAVTRLLTGCASISRHHPINTTRSFALRQASTDMRSTMPSGTYDPYAPLPTPGRRDSHDSQRKSYEAGGGEGGGSGAGGLPRPPPSIRTRHHLDMETDAAHTGGGSPAATPHTEASVDVQDAVGGSQKQLRRLLQQLEAELQVSVLPKVKKPATSAASASLTSPRDLLRATMMRGRRTLWQLLEGLEEDPHEEEAGGDMTAAAAASRRAVFSGHAATGTAAGTAAGVAAVGQGPAVVRRERVVVRRREHRLRAADALADASHAARKAGPLVQIPEWALMPGWWQQRWLTCGVAALFALWGARWLWAGGTNKLVHWSTTAWGTTQASVQAHIVSPLRVVHEELTKTFRNRPSIVSPKEFAADKDSLMRMLKDFERDVGPATSSQAAATAVALAAGSNNTASAPGTSNSAGVESGSVVQSVAAGAGEDASGTARGLHTVMTDDEQDALIRGMNLVMSRYETELRDPLRNLLLGQLARSLLIQVQRLKLDTEAAMLELDQILRANELSISLVAAIPALAISWGALSTVTKWLMPRAPDVKRAAVPCRMALAALERALQQLADQEAAAAAGAEAGVEGPQPGAAVLAGGLEVPKASWADAEGMTIYHINKVYNEAMQLFKSHDRQSRFSEWPSLSTDLAELGTVSGAAARLRVIDRMLRTYKVFQR